MATRIYFDNAATTPLDARVGEAMQPYLREQWGNPSTMYCEGRQARAAVEEARQQVAELLGAEPGEIVFTSSGTEADNLALQGVLLSAGLRDCHVIASAIEHPAVLACCRHLERLGVAVTLLPVDRDSLVDPVELERALRPETRLVSIMAANNETGVIEPIEELGRISRRHGAVFHTDAVQAFGKIPLDVRRLPVDLLSLSAHKLHGPKGVGAQYVRRGVSLTPILHGGGQEGGRRSSTENVAGIVGLGMAAALARAEMAAEAARLVQIRDRLIDTITATIPNAYLIGDRYRRLPGHICLGFAGMEGEAIKLLLELDSLGVAVASGSACSSHHAGQPSHVLEAMGFDAPRARGSLRITLGRFNTHDEAERFLELLPCAVASLRPLGNLARAS
jgi:cysteine desulfurase